MVRVVSVSVQLLSVLVLLLSGSGHLPRGRVDAAAIICGGSGLPAKNNPTVTEADGGATTGSPAAKPTGSAASEVNQFLERVQCTLEKAKPWVEEFEKDVLRFEESAKRVGVRIIGRFSDLFDTLLGHRPSVSIRPVLDVDTYDTDTNTDTDIDTITDTAADADANANADTDTDTYTTIVINQSSTSVSTTTEHPQRPSTVNMTRPAADAANVADNEIPADGDDRRQPA